MITKSEIGGAQTHVLSLIENMVSLGNSVGLIASPGGWLEEEARKAGVEFFPNKYFSNTINPFSLLKSYFVIKKNVKSFSPDLISLHSSMAGIIGRLVIRKKIPTIFTAHSFAFTDGAPVIRKYVALFFEKLFSRYIDKIICVSDFDRKLALRYKICNSNKLVVVHNGIFINPPSVEVVKKDKVSFISVGRLAYPKKFNLIIEAFSILPKDVLSKVDFKIIGYGPLEEEIKACIARNNLKEKIFIKKVSREELFRLYDLSDVFILISKHEGLPMTILEAMERSLPVIASAVGGIREEVDQKTGILIYKNTKEEIAHAVTTLVNDFNMRNKMGEEGRNRAEDLFSLNKFLTETTSVYQEVLLKKHL